MEKKELNRETKFDEYLDSLIGVINFNDPDLDFEYLYKIDSARLIQSKHAVSSMIESISSEQVMIMFEKDTVGLRNFAEIDALDLEILLNHLVLGILVSIKNKNKACLKHYQDKVLFIETANAIKYNHAIIYSADFYDQELTRLINEKQATIDKLLETNYPNNCLIHELEERFLTHKNTK